MTTFSGPLLKLKSTVDFPSDYFDSKESLITIEPQYEMISKVNEAFTSESKMAMNEKVGSELSLEFKNERYCLDTGRKLKKLFKQGYSFESTELLASLDDCIVRPELCHYFEGTCRQPEWGEANCLKPHIMYLSFTDAPKIGITRQTQIPTRWIDQGASYALPLGRVKDRRTSGKIEIEIAKVMKDRTSWKDMLSNDYTIDHGEALITLKKELLKDFAKLFTLYEMEVLSAPLVEIKYPVSERGEIKQINLKEETTLKEKLLGIKGQYLLFPSGVFNVRKHQGHVIYLD